MIPFEYTMVREDETVFGVSRIMQTDIDRLRTKGISESMYPQEIDREITEDPSNPIGYVKKSLTLQKSNPMGAMEAAEEGLHAVGDNHLLYHSRAMVLELGGRRAAAISDLRKAVDLYPISVETLVTLGTLLNRDKRYQEAIQYWNRLIEMNPESWIAWNGKAKAEHELGDNERAARHLTAAIYIRPEEPAFRENRGQIYFDLGRIDDGIADFEKAVELGGDRKHVVRNMKEITPKLIQSKAHADLVRIYEKALEIDPDNFDTLMGLSAGYTFLGREDDSSTTAGKLYRASLKLDQPQQIEMISQALLGMNRLKEAAGLQKRLYELTGNKDYLLNLAHMARLLDDPSLIMPYMSELLNNGTASTKLTKDKYKDVGRNDPCPCGSGQKFKKCHGN